MKTENIIRHLKLPFQFDEKELVQDLKSAQEAIWTAHFNRAGYEGEWKVIPLYAPKGDPTNIFALQQESAELAPTPLMLHCPYFQHVLQQFHCPLLSVRLLKLGMGAEIKPHRDHELGYEDGCFRLHIPIKTNPQVDFILDGEKLDMQPGDCWYTNVNFVHSVANRGKSDRVHLVIDGARNAWSDELFFSLAPKASFFPDKFNEQSHSRDTLLKMIAELEKMDNEASRDLIAKLRAQLG